MYIRKVRDMRYEFNTETNRRKLEAISKEIDIVLKDIDSAIAGNGKVTLEDIEKQLMELQSFVLTK